MSDLIPIPKRKLPSAGVGHHLPIKEIDDLTRAAKELCEWARAIEKSDSNADYFRQPRETFDARAHAPHTLAKLQALLKPATSADIAGMWAVLRGMYPGRSDNEVLATVGVDLIAAEEPSIIAVWAATLALLRPIPAYQTYGLTGIDRPEEIRKFMPPPGEVVAEVSKQNGIWRQRLETIERLVARTTQPST